MKKRHVLTTIMTAAMAVNILSGYVATSNAPTAAATKGAAAPAESRTDTAPAAKAGSGTWPNDAVQLLVPPKAGGVTDIYTRNIQNYLQSATNGNFVTVSYDSETIGYENLRSARADSSTLLFQHSTMICKYLTGAIDYNLQDSFRVVGVAANMGSQAIICRPDAPYNAWVGFIEYTKASPGQVTTVISANDATHFIFSQVQQNYTVVLNMVECSSETNKLTNVAGGIVGVANYSLDNAKGYETAGKLKVLGVLGSGQPEANYPEWGPTTDVIWESYICTFALAEIDGATAEAINTAPKGIPENAAYCGTVEKIGGTAMYLTVGGAQRHFDDTMTSLGGVATGLGINIRRAGNQSGNFPLRIMEGGGRGLPLTALYPSFQAIKMSLSRVLQAQNIMEDELMKNKDRIGGIIFAIFRALITSMASGIRMPANLSEPGSGLFPCIAGVGMLICRLEMAVTVKGSDDEAPFLEEAGWKRLGIVALTLVLYYFGLEYIGLLIMTPIFAFAAIMVLSSGERINRILAVIVAVLIIVILYLLFQRVFVILLPAGRLISFTL